VLGRQHGEQHPALRSGQPALVDHGAVVLDAQAACEVDVHLTSRM
jgi:hypothetical protein